MQNQQRINNTEKFTIALVTIILLIGLVLYFTNIPSFEKYIQEDGIVEWITVLGLLMGSYVCFKRFFQLRSKKSIWFLTVTCLAGIFLFFAAGEEISWGQRIFQIESSEFFKENNAQGETNLHNLVVGGKKINKIIFSIGLVAVMGIYLLIFPVLYHYKEGFRKFADKSAIPIPRLYQIITILVVFGITEIIRHGKRAELLEAGESLLVFLIILFPLNKKIFEK